MILSGVFFGGSTIGIELILGWWTDVEGAPGIGYALIEWVEEPMEFSGITLFLYTLVRYWRGEEAASYAHRPGRVMQNILSAWALRLILGDIVVSGGWSTYFEYEDHRG